MPDMLWSAVRHEVAFQDYLDWDFATLTHAERVTYMTHPKANHISMSRNDPVARRDFADKIRFNERFAEWIGRAWLDVREASAEQVAAFVREHDQVMAKVPDSLSGYGITKHGPDDVDGPERAEAFRTRLLEGRQFLLEAFITQHPRMAELCPTSVNSLRIITWFDVAEARTHVLARVLKIGNGAPIDNFSNGGMYTMVDERGTALYPAFDTTGTAYATHPGSGVDIVGFELPLFAETLEMVDAMCRVEPRVPYVGWDVAIAPDRPIVIEGNPNSGVYQAKPSVSGVRTGLLPLYRSAIGF
ncbi:MAG: hypothetical protein J0G30_13815 [Actinomycetales bacterium]|nr:hypothetical protein [Actinomycetales bacterium]